MKSYPEVGQSVMYAGKAREVKAIALELVYDLEGLDFRVGRYEFEGDEGEVVDMPKPGQVRVFDGKSLVWESPRQSDAESNRELVGYLLRDSDGIFFGERIADGYLAWGDRNEVEPTHEEYVRAELAVQRKLENEDHVVIKVTRKSKP